MNFITESLKIKKMPIIMDRSIPKRSLSGSGGKLVKVITLSLLLFPLFWYVLPAKAQNPFISKDDQRQVSSAPGLPLPFLAKIAFWQQQLKEKMAALTRQAKETGSLRPLLALIMIAFTYGVLHAVGPGHGKAVAASYLVSRGKKPGRGIILGNMTALFHGLSGVGLVLIVHFVLRKSITGSLESTAHATQIISYSLIVLLGAVLLIKSLVSWRRHNGNKGSSNSGRSEERLMNPMAVALAVGMIPCPGVVLVMLFCLSMNVMGLGLLLAFSVILGMGVTISAVGVVAIGGKNLALGVMEGRHKMAEKIERGIETAASLILMTIGLLFLAVTI